MAGVARAWALGRESARSGVTAVTARMAARGGPALGEMARQARSGVAEVVPAVARRLAPAGRGVATASVDVAARSGQGLRRGARAASRGLPAMIAACARDVERARRAAASLGAEVAQETRSAAQAASAEAQRGLGRVSRVAFRLRDTFPAIAGRGVRGAHSIQRRLGHAVSGLAVARRTWAEHRARAGVAVGAVSAALVERAQRDLGFRESPRRAVVTAVGGIATGLSLVLIATGVFHRPVAPRPGPAAIASVSALESPARLTTPQEPLAVPEGRVTTSDTVKEFPAGAPWSGSPEVVAPRAAAPVPPPSTPRRRPPHARVAGGARAGPSPSGPLEVVAIRFGVIDRQPPDWKWSWRVTVAKPDKAARVNARIEYIEFEGAKRRVVGYEELCGVPLTGGRLESIEGVRTISAEESRRISAVTATVSPASERADRGGCRATGAPVLAGPRPS
jgi:hypothetical protein